MHSDEALALWRRGLSIIPVPRPNAHHDGKVPAIAWKPYQTTRATEAQVRQWFEIDRNVAIVTGAISGVVVVDADSPEAVAWADEHLDPTPWVVLTAKGHHRYYRKHPFGTVRNKARIRTRDGRIALDVRGDHGYVIGPGSLHASGHVYTAIGEWSVPREDLPVFCESWITASSRTDEETPRPTHRIRSGDVVDRARRYLHAIPKPEIGHGSDAEVLRAACRLTRGFALDPATATALLDEWAGGRPGWSQTWVARKVENALRYGTEPIGGAL